MNYETESLVHEKHSHKRNGWLYVLCVLTIFTIIAIPCLVIGVFFLKNIESIPSDPIERAKYLMKNSLLIDGHNDLPEVLSALNDKNITVNLNEKTTEEMQEEYKKYIGNILQTDIPRMKEGHVGAQFFISYAGCEDNQPTLTGFQQIDVIKNLILESQNSLKLGTNLHSIEHAHGKIVVFIGLENGRILNNDIGLLKKFYKTGVRYICLTHNCHTDWAESCCDSSPHPGGLTEFGEKMIHEMNKLGIIVDLSHTSHQTQLDAIRVSKAPVIFSHSNAYTLCKSPRNVKDEVLQELKKNGGIIMVTFVPSFVSEDERIQYDYLKQVTNSSKEFEREMKAWKTANPDKESTLEKVVDHIDYLVKTIGTDHVGIGSDFDGMQFLTRGLEDVSKFVNLIAELVKRKYTDDQIKKILSGNFKRVLKNVEEISQKIN